MKIFTLFFFTALTFSLSAQQKKADPCLFDQLSADQKNSIEKSENIIRKTIKASPVKTGNIRYIPVVIHVIHNGGSENISEAQILSQFEVLNEDFRRMAGTNGFGNGVDTEVEFRLAKLTPEGECTNGIVRIKSPLTVHLTHQRDQLAGLSFWDNSRYLNVYIVKSINNGSAGYSSFPGGPDQADGIVVLHNYFGKTGTASAGLGRTMTHEVGHWLGLYHTFQDGCGNDQCSEGDYVCDTPPALTANFNCSNVNSCSNDVPDLNDQVQNYMDYSSDACRNMFTQGQKQRMDASLNSLRWNIWQTQNIISTGIDSGYVSPSCNVIADFTSNGKELCKGSAVNFINKSQNNPLTYQWFFPGANPASSTLVNPTVVYDSTGSYDVSLISTNAVGTDTVTFSNYIVVSQPVSGQALNFSEGFEDPGFPSNGITIENPDTGVTWEKDTLAYYSGQASVKINNLVNTNYGQADAFYLPELDLTSYNGTPYLSFKYAYARTSTLYSDELSVLLSKDCGLNFTQILYKSGTSLSTAPVQTTPFIPDSTQWKSAKVNLTLYKNYNNVILKFINVTDGGNNLYIDNIVVGDTGLISGSAENNLNDFDIRIFPNPSVSSLEINYTLIKREEIKLSLNDSRGQEIYFFKEHKDAGRHSYIISPENIPAPGIYFLTLKTESSNHQKKVVILNTDH